LFYFDKEGVQKLYLVMDYS